MTADGRRKHNWLLSGFFLISVGLHAWVLGHTTGLPESRTVTYTELEILENAQPSQRNVPEPPRKAVARPATEALKVEPVKPVAVNERLTEPVAPIVASAQPSLVQPVTVPDHPGVSPLEAIAWSPPAGPPKEEVPAHSGSASRASSRDYFSMVRTRIEKHKQYPYTARKRRIQGRVVVRFVIDTDGGLRQVSIVEKSRHESLNDAAIKAVRTSSPFPRPPTTLFSGPVPVEISMVFELM